MDKNLKLEKIMRDFGIGVWSALSYDAEEVIKHQDFDIMECISRHASNFKKKSSGLVVRRNVDLLICSMYYPIVKNTLIVGSVYECRIIKGFFFACHSRGIGYSVNLIEGAIPSESINW